MLQIGRMTGARTSRSRAECLTWDGMVRKVGTATLIGIIAIFAAIITAPFACGGTVGQGTIVRGGNRGAVDQYEYPWVTLTLERPQQQQRLGLFLFEAGKGRPTEGRECGHSILNEPFGGPG